MSATINNQGVNNVTPNSVHIKDGRLYLTAIALSHRFTKLDFEAESDSTDHIASKPFLNMLNDLNSNGTALTKDDGNGKFILTTDVRNTRSQESIYINFPADLSTLDQTVLVKFIDSVVDRLYVDNAENTVQYLEPTEDNASAKFNFSGTFGADGSTATLECTSISLA